jgi:hypothetical protein
LCKLPNLLVSEGGEPVLQFASGGNLISHAAHPTGCGRSRQPNSEDVYTYSRATDFGEGLYNVDSKRVLWRSVSALMRKHYGEENLTRLARDCKIGPGTASRMKEAKTSVGLEIVEKIAKHFHVETWELLVPSFDPANRPTLQPVTEQERRLYERLREVAKELKET